MTAIAAGGAHSLALTSTAAVLAWGSNVTGQLGDDTTADRSTPVLVGLPPDTTVTAVSAASNHNLALTSTGRILAWGANDLGELGDGTTTDRHVPGFVSLPQGVTAAEISARMYHSMALSSTGAVLGWGYNAYGQIGDGSTDNQLTPASVALPAGVTVAAISAGFHFSLALTSGGDVLAWGYDSTGQSGDGGGGQQITPVGVALPEDADITAIDAGENRALALEVGPTPQAITFEQPSPITYGDPDTQLDATASSHLPVAFTTSTPDVCTVSASGALHVVGAGDCAITATQPGDDEYAEADPVKITIPIDKASQAITFSSTAPDDATVGDHYTVAAAGGDSGNPVVFAVEPDTAGVCAVDGSDVAFTGPGDCVISTSQAGSDNYRPAPANEQTITAAPAPSRRCGSPPRPCPTGRWGRTTGRRCRPPAARTPPTPGPSSTARCRTGCASTRTPA